ncbi:MAG: pilus assembly protein [Chloroflexi bacterium]|nr:pilus assembly protein [Chloroflexota bacterium]
MRVRVGGAGQSLVEFALIVPTLLFLVMGALQIALLCLVTMSLQGLAQDTARWYAISSRADSPGPAPNCASLAGTSRWPRARWADGRDSETRNYRDCNLPPILDRSRFTRWEWRPACADGQDCYASGVRTANQKLTLTVEYDWRNVAIMPGLSAVLTALYGEVPRVTVVASEVMQY